MLCLLSWCLTSGQQMPANCEEAIVHKLIKTKAIQERTGNSNIRSMWILIQFFHPQIKKIKAAAVS